MSEGPRIAIEPCSGQPNTNLNPQDGKIILPRLQPKNGGSAHAARGHHRGWDT